jgi:hypothetical protein
MTKETAISILKNTAWLGSEKELCAVEEAIRMAVEALGVVRCKDCKFYKTPYCKIDIHTDIMTINRVHDDDFCSYGERKENE